MTSQAKAAKTFTAEEITAIITAIATSDATPEHKEVAIKAAQTLPQTD